jgi:hypothetical protein
MNPAVFAAAAMPILQRVRRFSGPHGTHIHQLFIKSMAHWPTMIL